MGVSIGTLGSSEAIRITQYQNRVGIFRTPSYMLDVAGSIRAYNTVYHSDASIKINIEPIKDYSSLIYKLGGVKYNLKDDLMLEPNVSSFKDRENNIQKRFYYGYLAQEVREVLPEIVYQDDEGALGIDYVALIPLIIEELKKKEERIRMLEDQLIEFKQGFSYSTNPSGTYQEANKLYQSNPNPSNTDTKIRVLISQNADNAKLEFYNTQGLIQKIIDIRERGEVNVIVKSGEFPAGVYTYTLVIDGIHIDSKRMVLTD